MKTKIISILAVLALSVPVGAGPFFLTPEMLQGITPQVIEAGNVITVDAVGFEFWDAEFDADNVTGAFAVGNPGDIWTGIGWDVLSTSVGDSWGSEMTVGFSADADLTTKDLVLTVSASDEAVSMQANRSDGIVKFGDLAIPNFPLVDGMVYYELYEDFDDVADAIDGFWEPGGTLSFQLVPEPRVMPMLLCGAVTGIYLRRRRGRRSRCVC